MVKGTRVQIYLITIFGKINCYGAPHPRVELNSKRNKCFNSWIFLYWIECYVYAMCSYTVEFYLLLLFFVCLLVGFFVLFCFVLSFWFLVLFWNPFPCYKLSIENTYKWSSPADAGTNQTVIIRGVSILKSKQKV